MSGSLLLAAIVGTAVASAPAGTPATPDPPPTAPAAEGWRPIAPGAERMTLTLEGGAEVLLARFDLDHFRAEVVVGKGSPPQRRTAADVRQGRGALAVVNGGFFDENVVPLGLRLASGEQRFPLRAKADWGVLLLMGHRARIVHTRDYLAARGAPAAPGDAGAPPAATPAITGAIEGAIQVGPRLVAEAKPLKLRPQVARRTAVALDREGRALTLVVSPEPIDANALASRLAALGFDSALLLDGGPSTQLSLALGDAHAEIAGAYAVPDLLAVFRRSSARRSAPPPPPSAPRPKPEAPPSDALPARRP